ncbi:hypothetical protein VaNZ11_008500 [Volvox africanus]|uniref:Uncharacterized protein n=1 Tax=Volvox africanus TaxID=51714 RepID=A0ABQ5S6J0_9CHLO|nr:hypothetical protein VaNZ11_008500 [Volvox africanus]
MPSELCSIASFNPDLDDWYSCHTSDDEAFQDALERNSIASFFTARGGVSTATSFVYTSIAISSPARLADADQALAEMVPEPIDYLDPRQQRDPPEIDEEDAPVLKRTRSAVPLQSAFSPSRSTSTPSTKTKANARVGARRGQIFRAFAVSSPSLPSSKVPHAAIPAAGSVRVSISVQPDCASVRVQILPAIFCFGDVPLPIPSGSTDYCAALLGPEGSVAAAESFLIKRESDSPQPQIFNSDEPTTPTAEPVATAQLDADCAVKLLTRPRGATLCKPDTPKDQNKKRQAKEKEGKSHDSGGGFPGFFLQRLFPSMRDSRGSNSANGCSDEDSLLPATVQELGSELLMASAVISTAGVAAAAQQIPVVAGYVQAAAPVGIAAAVPVTAPSASAISLNTGREPGMIDEAAAAAHNLSVEIFRNVLQAAADNVGGDSTPKALLSPRDIAFPSTEARMPQRDQIATVPTTWAAEVSDFPSADAIPLGGSDFERMPISHQDYSPSMSQKQTSPSDTALELLVSLASGVTETEGRKPVALGRDATTKTNKHKAAPDPAPAEVVAEVERYSAGGALAENDGQVTPSLSTDGLALDCSGLPMPELEKCESPVTVGAPPVGVAVDDADAASIHSNVDGQEGGLHAATAAVDSSTAPAKRLLIPSDAGPTTASPRTVSKRAYGTVARLVKKIAPDFRDTTVLSMSTSSIQASALAAPAAVAVSVEEVIIDQSQELQSAGALFAASREAMPSGGGDVLTKATEFAAVAEQPRLGDPKFGAALTVVDLDGSAAEEGATDCTSEPAPGVQADVAVERLESAMPSLFVFGQEQSKGAKLGSGRARSFTSKAPTVALSAADDPALYAEAAGRKRKAVDEILPDAKVPVFVERSSPDDLELAPHFEQATVAATVSPLPTEGEMYPAPQAAAVQEARSIPLTHSGIAVEQVATTTKSAGVQESHAAAPTIDAQELPVPGADKQLLVVAVISNTEAAVLTPAASSIEAEVPSAVAVISKECKQHAFAEGARSAATELSAAVRPGAHSAMAVIVNDVPDLGGLSTVSGTHTALGTASPQLEPAKEGPTRLSPEPAVAVTAAHADVRHSPGATVKHEEPICASAKTLGPAGVDEAVAIRGNFTVPEHDLALDSTAVAPQVVTLLAETSIGEGQARATVAPLGGATHEPNVLPVARPQAVASTKELVPGLVLGKVQGGTKEQLVAPEAAPDTQQPQEELRNAPAGAAAVNTEIEASPVEVIKAAGDALAAGNVSKAAGGEPTERAVEVFSPKLGSPTDGGKHKRRNSGFSFFNCFR